MNETTDQVTDIREEKLYSAADFSKRIGISIPTLRKLRNEGLFMPAYKTFGGRPLYGEHQIDEYFEYLVISARKKAEQRMNAKEELEQ